MTCEELTQKWDIDIYHYYHIQYVQNIMAQCTTPYHDKNKGSFPCGKCYDCRMNRVTGWTFRLNKEAERSSSALFVTLTYDTDYVPITPNGFMTLHKPDIQNFFKRLRKLHEKDAIIKYYAVGEYGSQTLRPHYHIILFNSSEDNIIKAWKNPITHKPIGQIHFGNIDNGSIGYTLKYICKESPLKYFKNNDREPEFSLMSKKLGDNYINERTIKYHHADINNRMYVPIMDGKIIPMPRYYKEKIYSQWQRLKISHHIENQQIKDYQSKNLSTIVKEEQKKHKIRIGKAAKNKQQEQRKNTSL